MTAFVSRASSRPYPVKVRPSARALSASWLNSCSSPVSSRPSPFPPPPRAPTVPPVGLVSIPVSRVLLLVQPAGWLVRKLHRSACSPAADRPGFGGASVVRSRRVWTSGVVQASRPAGREANGFDPLKTGTKVGHKPSSMDTTCGTLVQYIDGPNILGTFRSSELEVVTIGEQAHGARPGAA